MSDEKARLDTFKDWISKFVTKEDLALNGFYYTNESDKVRCFVCSLELSECGDTVIDEHRRFSPNCKIVRGDHTINVPINEEAWRI